MNINNRRNMTVNSSIISFPSGRIVLLHRLQRYIVNADNIRFFKTIILHTSMETVLDVLYFLQFSLS